MLDEFGKIATHFLATYGENLFGHMRKSFEFLHGD
jgi:hypothetical protein